MKTKEFKFWKIGLRSRHPSRLLVRMIRLGGAAEYRFLRVSRPPQAEDRLLN